MTNDLDKKIREYETAHGLTPPPPDGDSGKSASRTGYELIAATLVFGFVGHLLDRQFGTTPALTLLLFFLGFATGVYNAWRALNGFNSGVGLKKSPENKGKNHP